MFGLRTPELLVILAVVVLLFGPNKLAGVGAGLGKSIRDFKKALNEEEPKPAAPAAAAPTSDEAKPEQRTGA